MAKSVNANCCWQYKYGGSTPPSAAILKKYLGIMDRHYDKEFWEKYGWVSCYECDIIFTDLEKLYEHQKLHIDEESDRHLK